MKKIRFTQAFTMIELLTMMIVIMIIAGITIRISSRAIRKAKIEKAEEMVAALEAAVIMYHADVGGYPRKLYWRKDLEEDPGLSTTMSWRGPYMEFNESEKAVIYGYHVALDPWDTEYFIDSTEHGLKHNKGGVDIWSNGPNKSSQSGWGDDITNW